MHHFLTIISALVFAIPAFAESNLSLEIEAGNTCYDRFHRHSRKSSMAVNRYGLCSRDHFYNSRVYKAVTWNDYFSCVDKVGPSLDNKMNYWSQCSNRRYNRFALSSEPSECTKKLVSFAPKASNYVCFLEGHSERILDEKFEGCVASSKKTGQSAIESLDLCSRSNWEEKLSCVQKLVPIFGSKEAFNRCEKRKHLDAVSSNSFEGCMQDMAALELSPSIGFEVCASEEPKDALECVNENRTGLEPEEQARRCLGKNFRETNDSRHFPSCLKQAAQDGFLKEEAIKLCTENEPFTKLIAKSDEFRECAKSAIEEVGIERPKAYATCKNNDVRKKILEPDFQQCLKKGLKAGIFGYFSQSNEGTERLADDCLNNRPVTLKENKYGAKLLGDYNIHTEAKFEMDGSELGGLSAIRFHGNKLYLLSDDKGFNGRPRAYTYSYKLNENGLKLQEENAIALKSQNRNKHGINVDPEGLDVLPNGAMIISSEVEDPKTSSPISIYSKTGDKIASIPMPKALNSHKNRGNTYTAGMRPNKGIEGLSLSPSATSLFFASEGALTQDRNLNKILEVDDKGKRKRKKAGDVSRIIQYELLNGRYSEKSQFYYRTEDEPDNGVSELLAISETELLVLERSWDSRKKKITARIFYVNLAKGQSLLPEPLKGHSLFAAQKLVLEKELLLDLDDLIPSLSPGFRSLENFEGLALGPKLQNGKHVLALVSDNNFSKSQRSVLLLLEADLDALSEENQ